MRRLALALILWLLAANAGAEGPLFHVVEVAAPGRTATAGLADLDGDGRADLYSVSLTGIPPDARRELRVHFQSPDGSFADRPELRRPLDEDAAAYDVAELDGKPGLEFLQLGRHAVSVLSLRGRKPVRRELRIPGDPTAAIAADERGIDRLRMARDLGSGLRLLVPGLGECIVLTPSGELVARVDAGHRANYYI
ncbi:MAG: VCBS repeat-containing protein, partial [Myxococcales bacterium]|nr:VCBS repeat-containing protein [Myxococcales bacterium]